MAGSHPAAAHWTCPHGGIPRRQAGPALIAGLILAGGQARRFGGVDKPLLEVGGSTILARILAALELTDVAISANGDPARFEAYHCPVLPDGPFAGQGPLAGVLAGLDWAFTIGATALLTVPGDTPLVPRGLALALSPPPACAASGGKVHNLVALWPVGAREALRARLSRPSTRHVVHFAEEIGIRRVDFPLMAWDAFLNVNSPADLRVAQSWIRATSETAKGRTEGQT